MESLASITKALDDLFRIDLVDSDPGFKHFVPMVYEPIGVDWRNYFEPDFNTRFNGLMMRGLENVETVFCGVFPSEIVLDRFLEESKPGDLFFSHHALDMHMGDPRRKVETDPFLLPIAETRLQAIRDKGLSYYSCHIPMDVNWEIGTAAAVVNLLQGTIVDHYCPGPFGPYGAICEIAPRSTRDLINELQTAHEVPYVETLGPEHNELTRVAIITGAGTQVYMYEEAAAKGAQAYVTGEVRNHIDNEIGRTRDAEIVEYAKTTSMSLIGTSHAASEFFVMKAQMQPWFEKNTGLKVKLLREDHWWR